VTDAVLKTLARLGLLSVSAGVFAGAAWAAPPMWVGGDAGIGMYTAGVGGAGAGSTTHSPGYLGVDLRDIGDEEVGALKLKESRGAEVIRVDHDGPAGKAGLREHDVILQMNGQVIEGEEQLRRMLRETPAGRTVTLLLSRDGQQQTVTTQLANRLEVERQAWEQRWIVPAPPSEAGAATSASPASPQSTSGSSNSTSGKGENFFSGPVARSGHAIGAILGSTYTGAMVETMGPQLAEFFGTGGGGILVHSVDQDSPAAKAGLHAGDVVIRANTVKLMTTGDWMKVVRENRGKSVEVIVLRDKKEQTLTLTPDGKKRSSVDRQSFDGGDGPTVVASRLGFSFR